MESTTISAFYFQYSEVKAREALQDFASFINQLYRTDRLIQEDENLCRVLRKENGWIEGEGKLASIEKIQKHRTAIEGQVSFEK